MIRANLVKNSDGTPVRYIDGRSKDSEYEIYHGMRRRCLNPKANRYHTYGAMGVKVCERWMEPKTGYSNFLEDVGRRPSPRHSIDRIDPTGDYEPGNVRWATAKEQSRNVRHRVEYNFPDGLMTLAEAAEFYGIKKTTLWMRLNRYKQSTTEAVQPVFVSGALD